MVRRSRTPQGVRGLKQDTQFHINGTVSRTPQGVRGLKPRLRLSQRSQVGSHSARSAWIETSELTWTWARTRVALRKECVD